MNYFYLILIMCINLLFLSYKKSNQAELKSESNKNGTNIQISRNQLSPLPPLINFGFYCQKNGTGYPSIIASYRSRGWNGICLDSHFWHDNGIATCNINYDTARFVNCSPILSSIWYPNVLFYPWNCGQGVYEVIDSAKNKGATWIYIDDGLTSYYNIYTPDSLRMYVSDSLMIALCHYVHTQGMLVAVSEQCETMECGRLLINRGRLDFYDSVDVVMPYGYGSNYSLDTLKAFYSFIKNTLHKKIVPVLGHDQRGSRSGDPGFIEQARDWAFDNMVFFWPGCDRELSSMADLNQYLHNYKYIIDSK